MVNGTTCDPLEDFPIGTMGGTGALLESKFPLICGGYTYSRPTTDQCKVLGKCLK